MLVHHFLEFYARSYAESPCVTLGDRHYTYQQLDQQVNKLANGLLDLGVGKEQRVAILGENSIEHGMTFLAAGKIGAVTVPLNYRLAAAELAYVIKDSETKVLIVLANASEQLAGLRQHLPADVTLITEDAEDSLHLHSWLEGFADTAPVVDVDRDAPFIQLYTSGTTGNPKGVVSSHYNLVQLSMMNALGVTYRPNIGSAVIIIAPMFHIGGAGSLLANFFNGQHALIHETFEPNKLLDDIETFPVESVFMVPAMIMFMLQVPGIEKRDFSGVKQIFYGASPISETVLKQAIEVFQCDFIQMYGMTETSGSVVLLTQGDHAKALADDPGLLRSCGRPSLGVSLKIMDDDGKEVATDEIGELWVKSDTNMLHYYNLPEVTAKDLTDGWVHTGDAGSMDENGYVYLKDRMKDMVISGGENIYPTEVENAVAQHPAVADVAVIGVPDDKFGEALLAVVVLKSEESLTAEELVDFCRDKIAGYKIPRQLKLIDELPRNPSGKILKKDLRAPYWQDSDRAIS